MKRFAVQEVPLKGAQLVEASAGTGKTHALSDLFVRLVVEAGHPIRSILTVTFTIAATDELKSRVRDRLREMRDQLRAGKLTEPALRAVAESRVAAPTALRRLEDAVRGYDEASIFTIHSFCQRALRDHAFDSGARFETEIAGDPDAIVAEIVGDFWRSRIAPQSALFVAFLKSSKIGPDGIRAAAARFLGRRRPIVRPEAVFDPAAVAAAQRPFDAALERARRLWSVERSAVSRLLQETPALNRRSYPVDEIPEWLDELAQWLDQPTLPLPEKVAKLRASVLSSKTRVRAVPLEHPLFQALEEAGQAAEPLAAALQTAWLGLYRELLTALPGEVDRRTAAAGQRTFDQLLTRLAAALEGPNAERLRTALRRDYRVALIDEFQDTDPLQYDIFRRIFDGHGGVFFIGDPKQSIYRFRGADLYAYRRAARNSDGAFTLTENWRSEPALVLALGALFDRGGDRPFLMAGIGFPRVAPAAAARHHFLRDAATAAALRVFFLARSAESTAPDGRLKPINQGEATERSIRTATAEIVRLLNAGLAGHAMLGDRPLGAGDLAVLGRSRRQCEEVYAELTRLGVPCVLYTQSSVFETDEAATAARVLEAVARPWDERLLRGALLVDWLGGAATAPARYEEDPAAWEACRTRFRDYHRRWREQGFLQMFQALLAGEGVAARLLGEPRGERRLTNLRQLAELAHTAAVREGLGVDGTLEWWARARQETDDAADERQLRLESDEERVKILTIHVSKGLQFPIVFAPFAWAIGPGAEAGARGRKRGTPGGAVEFHDPEHDDTLTLDLGSEDWDRAGQLESAEEQAEALRLFYVALTRARNRAYFTWGAVKGADTSAPAWFIHRPDPPAPGTLARFDLAALPDSRLRQDLARIALATGGAMEIADAPDAPAALTVAPAPAAAEFRPRAFSGVIRDDWRVASFSALTAEEDGDPDRPDRDAAAPPADAVAAPAPNTPASGIHAFPRGPRAGSMLHTLFERLDFDAAPDAVRATAEDVLAEYGFDARWAHAVTEAAARVMATPLSADDPTLRLAAIPRRRRTDEMEFHYPLARVRADDLGAIFRAHNVALPLRDLPVTLERLQFAPLRGFMKGYVDLVFEHRGRFALADYKSNWLGPAASAYTPERIAAEMAQACYGLQYHIYTVALHRWLRYRRGAAYDYDRDFAGVFYLFVRGMSPESGPTLGVFHDRPARALIEALSDYFERG